MLYIVETISGNESIEFAETVPMASSLYNGWSIIAGIMTVTRKLIDHERISVVLYGPHKDMNVYYDDISIEPIPKECTNLILNGNFEVGDTRFWRVSNRNYIDVEISDVGADGSNYSSMMRPMIHSYTGNSLRQQLDPRCLIEGQEYLITAKFKLLNTTNLSSGVECLPNELNVGRSSHCPTITIKGTGCIGSDLEYVFWNEIDDFRWEPDAFNNYEKLFAVGAEISLCEVSNRNYSVKWVVYTNLQNFSSP